MIRREFIAGLGAAAWPLAARAQQRTKPIIGWFDVRPGGPLPEFVEGFRRGLAETGFSEGRDVTLSTRPRTAIASGCQRLPLIWCAEGQRRS
jgi:putative tryptophan/tyrosine transport system substrate-binding protein